MPSVCLKLLHVRGPVSHIFSCTLVWSVSGDGAQLVRVVVCHCGGRLVGVVSHCGGQLVGVVSHCGGRLVGVVVS